MGSLVAPKAPVRRSRALRSLAPPARPHVRRKCARCERSVRPSARAPLRLPPQSLLCMRVQIWRVGPRCQTLGWSGGHLDGPAPRQRRFRSHPPPGTPFFVAAELGHRIAHLSVRHPLLCGFGCCGSSASRVPMDPATALSDAACCLRISAKLQVDKTKDRGRGPTLYVWDHMPQKAADDHAASWPQQNSRIGSTSRVPATHIRTSLLTGKSATELPACTGRMLPAAARTISVLMATIRRDVICSSRRHVPPTLEDLVAIPSEQWHPSALDSWTLAATKNCNAGGTDDDGLVHICALGASTDVHFSTSPCRPSGRRQDHLVRTSPRSGLRATDGRPLRRHRPLRVAAAGVAASQAASARRHAQSPGQRCPVHVAVGVAIHDVERRGSSSSGCAGGWRSRRLRSRKPESWSRRWRGGRRRRCSSSKGRRRRRRGE